MMLIPIDRNLGYRIDMVKHPLSFFGYFTLIFVCVYLHILYVYKCGTQSCFTIESHPPHPISKKRNCIFHQLKS